MRCGCSWHKIALAQTNLRRNIDSTKDYSQFFFFFHPLGAGYKSSNVSFLFSLRNPNNLQPFKCPIITNGYAIHCNYTFGAIFGGGHDLLIDNNANSNQSSCSNLGNTYQPPPGYQRGTQQNRELFAGSHSFTPTEVEVFY